MTIGKKSYRICPCNAYDIEGIQSWLEDLALEGLVLERDGYFGGFFTFAQALPRPVIYRLIPVKKENISIFDENDPDGEEVETSAEMGWTYLVRYGMFHIYCTHTANPRELHTDPAVQSLALNFLRKRLVSNIVTTFIWLFIWFALRSSPFGFPFRSAAAIGLVFTLGFYGWLALGLFKPVGDVIRLVIHQKRLRSGDSLTARKNWKKRAPLIVFSKLLEFILPVLVLAGAAVTLTEASLQPVTPDTSVPFVTIADLMPEGIYEQADSSFGDYNEYRSWSTTAAPVNIEWNEWGQVTGTDGTFYKGILRIDYHECTSEWFARQLANDYYQYDLHRYRKFETLESLDAPVDSIRHYSNYLPYVLIQHDNIVIHATMTIHDQNDDIVRDIWVEATAKWLNQR